MRCRDRRAPLILNAAILIASTSFINSASAQDKTRQKGERVFMDSHCFVCHGQYGNGGAGPKFDDDRFLGLTDYVIAQILIGRSIMPPFADKLDNDQIADVASYIRNSWGNNFGAVSPNEVAKVRKQVSQIETRAVKSGGPAK